MCLRHRKTSPHHLLPEGLCVVMRDRKLPVSPGSPMHFCQFLHYDQVQFNHIVTWDFSNSSEDSALKRE